MEYKFHKIAELFPLMEKKELNELAESIKQNGLLEPITLYENKILDGRNRYLASKIAGITPKFIEWNGDNPVSWVIAKNLERRHLTPSQKATVALEALPFFEIEAKKRHPLQGKTKEGKPSIREILPEMKGRARDQAGKSVGVSGRLVSDAKIIKDKSPEAFKEVKEGKKTISQAKREIKREENRKIAEKTPKVEMVTDGQKFRTILIDPPWDVSDEGDVNQMGRANPDYETMSIDKIKHLPISKLSEKDSHIYLWITNRSLPKGFDLLKEWECRYITILTWCKPSIGIGNYFRNNTEHILFGVKGKMPLLRQNIGTWFAWKRGNGHSSKPEEIYQLIESCSQGPYLEMFARKKRNGWAAWGAEINGNKK